MCDKNEENKQTKNQTQNQENGENQGRCFPYKQKYTTTTKNQRYAEYVKYSQNYKLTNYKVSKKPEVPLENTYN
tara:strand:- start:257 stop:478 length:222 start_codon:yes stop_codon:yes gene_type:complete